MVLQRLETQKARGREQETLNSEPMVSNKIEDQDIHHIGHTAPPLNEIEGKVASVL